MTLGNLLPMLVLGTKASRKAKNAAIMQMFGGKGGQAKLISDVSTFTALKEIDKSEKNNKAQVTVLASEKKTLAKDVEDLENIGVKLMEVAFKKTGTSVTGTFNSERVKDVLINLKKVEDIRTIDSNAIKEKFTDSGVVAADIKNL